jgi:hypothetical protein
MPRESWSILGSWRGVMTVQSRPVQQHCKAGGAFGQCAECRTAKPQYEVALPVTWNRTVIRLGRALADHNLG